MREKLLISLLLLAVLSPMASAYTNADAVGGSGTYHDWNTYYAAANPYCPWSSNPNTCLLVQGAKWSMGMWAYPYFADWGYLVDFGSYIGMVNDNFTADRARMDYLQAEMDSTFPFLFGQINDLQNGQAALQQDVNSLASTDAQQNASITSLNNSVQALNSTIGRLGKAGIPQGIIAGNFSACQQTMLLSNASWAKAQNPNCMATSPQTAGQYQISTYYYPNALCSTWKQGAKQGGGSNAGYYCDYKVLCQPCEV